MVGRDESHYPEIGGNERRDRWRRAGRRPLISCVREIKDCNTWSGDQNNIRARNNSLSLHIPLKFCSFVFGSYLNSSPRHTDTCPALHCRADSELGMWGGNFIIMIPFPPCHVSHLPLFPNRRTTRCEWQNHNLRNMQRVHKGKETSLSILHTESYSKYHHHHEDLFGWVGSEIKLCKFAYMIMLSTGNAGSFVMPARISSMLNHHQKLFTCTSE